MCINPSLPPGAQSRSITMSICSSSLHCSPFSQALLRAACIYRGRQCGQESSPQVCQNKKQLRLLTHQEEEEPGAMAGVQRRAGKYNMYLILKENNFTNTLSSRVHSISSELCLTVFFFLYNDCYFDQSLTSMFAHHQ